tara:strand:+ start:198 stop:302 length:105 start_codon:yes stop_codon:yes gene_type:complete
MENAMFAGNTSVYASFLIKTTDEKEKHVNIIYFF